MNCLRKKNESRNHTMELVLTSVAYSMLDRGYTLEEVEKVLTHIDEVCDSLVGDYVKFLEIRKALKEEYGFELRFHD